MDVARIPVFISSAKSFTAGWWRSAGPSVLVTSSVLLAYGIGKADGLSWFLFVPVIIATGAAGWAADQASARVAKETTLEWYAALMRGNDIEIVITHRTESTPSPSTIGEG